MELKFKRVRGVVYAGIKPFRGRTKWVSMKTHDMSLAKQFAKESKLFKMQAVESANALSHLVFTRLQDVTIPTVSAAIDQFMEASSVRGLAPATLSSLRKVLLFWMREAEVGAIPCNQIKQDHFRLFFNPPDGGDVKLTTLQDRRDTCAKFCEWMRDQGYVTVNSAKSVGIDRSKLAQEQLITKSHHPITVEERDRILSKLPPHTFWHLAVVLAWDYGLRIGDICQLEKVSVVDNKLRLVTRKTGTFVHLPLNDGMSAMLNSVSSTEHAHEQRFLFPKEKAEYNLWGASYFAGHFKKVCLSAGVNDKTFHGFRTAYIQRTYAEKSEQLITKMANELAKRETAAAVGHSNTNATDIYLRAGTSGVGPEQKPSG